jgi:transposase-like protein
MHRRTWEAKTTARMVIAGLRGQPVAELCTAPHMSQAQSYQWREQLLAPAPTAFEGHEPQQQAARLEREHSRVNTRVGELLWE